MGHVHFMTHHTSSGRIGAARPRRGGAGAPSAAYYAWRGAPRWGGAGAPSAAYYASRGAPRWGGAGAPSAAYYAWRGAPRWGGAGAPSGSYYAWRGNRHLFGLKMRLVGRNRCCGPDLRPAPARRRAKGIPAEIIALRHGPVNFKITKRRYSDFHRGNQDDLFQVR